MQVIKNSDKMKEQWFVYQKKFEYARNIDFQDTCDVILKIMDKLMV